MNKDNPPAFPTSDWDENDKAYKMHGITMRDYFAAKALPTVLKRWTEDAIRDKELSLLELDGDPTDLATCVAEECYAMADAMMEARK